MGNAKFGIWNQRKSWLTDTLETNNISHRQSQQNQPYQFDREKEILRRHDNVSMVVLHSLTSQEQRAQCGGSEILWNLGWSSVSTWFSRPKLPPLKRKEKGERKAFTEYFFLSFNVNLLHIYGCCLGDKGPTTQTEKSKISRQPLPSSFTQ